MKVNKKGKAVKNMKGYSTLSVLEREVYSKLPNYKPQYTNHAIMEIAIYNPTVHENKGTWAKIKRRIKNLIQKEY